MKQYADDFVREHGQLLACSGIDGTPAGFKRGIEHPAAKVRRATLTAVSLLWPLPPESLPQLVVLALYDPDAGVQALALSQLPLHRSLRGDRTLVERLARTVTSATDLHVIQTAYFALCEFSGLRDPILDVPIEVSDTSFIDWSFVTTVVRQARAMNMNDPGHGMLPDKSLKAEYPAIYALLRVEKNNFIIANQATIDQYGLLDHVDNCIDAGWYGDEELRRCVLGTIDKVWKLPGCTADLMRSFALRDPEPDIRLAAMELLPLYRKHFGDAQLIRELAILIRSRPNLDLMRSAYYALRALSLMKGYAEIPRAPEADSFVDWPLVNQLARRRWLGLF